MAASSAAFFASSSDFVLLPDLIACIAFSLSSISCSKSNKVSLASSPAILIEAALASIIDFFLLAKLSNNCSRSISSAAVSLFSALSKSMRLFIAFSFAFNFLFSSATNFSNTFSSCFLSSIPSNSFVLSITAPTPLANPSSPGIALKANCFTLSKFSTNSINPTTNKPTPVAANESLKSFIAPVD